jgi:choline dehydrogenase-like flavoprotein
MTGLASEVDVAVLGAGAAGIGAARRLGEAADLSLVVLEGRERAGGRAYTVEAAGMPMDPVQPGAARAGMSIPCSDPGRIRGRVGQAPACFAIVIPFSAECAALFHPTLAEDKTYREMSWPFIYVW